MTLQDNARLYRELRKAVYDEGTAPHQRSTPRISLGVRSSMTAAGARDDAL
jgi:hypothetical protein